MRASVLDAKVSSAKSVGGNIAAGADIFQTMANYLKSLVDMVMEFMTSGFFGSNSETAKALIETRRKERVSQDNLPYGAGTSAYQGKRVVLPK